MKLETSVFLFAFLCCGLILAESGDGNDKKDVSLNPETENNNIFLDKVAKSLRMGDSKKNSKKVNKKDEYLKKVLTSEEEGLTQKTKGIKEEGESNENSTTSVSNDDTKESEVTTDQSVSSSNITGVDTDTTNENTKTIPTSAESSKNDFQNETPVKLDLELEEIAQNNTSVEATSETNKDNNEEMMEEISSEPNKEGEIVTDSNTKLDLRHGSDISVDTAITTIETDSSTTLDLRQGSDISVDTEINTIEPQTPILESVTKNTLEQLNEIGSIVEQLMKINNTSNNGTVSISSKELQKVNDLVKGLTKHVSEKPDIEDENKDSEENLFEEESFVWTPSKQDEQPNKSGNRTEEEKLKPFMNIIKDIIIQENTTLEQYDWLGNTVDILAALEKLTKLLSNTKIRNIYSQETKEQLRKIQQNIERNIEKEIRHKKFKKPSLLLRNNLKNLNRYFLSNGGLIDKVWPYKSRINKTENEAHERIDELQDLVEDLRVALYDVHNTLRNKTFVTRFKKHDRLNNLREIDLVDEDMKQYLKVLQHISTARLLSLIEDRTTNELEDDQDFVEKIQKEFVYLMQIMGELKTVGE